MPGVGAQRTPPAERCQRSHQHASPHATVSFPHSHFRTVALHSPPRAPAPLQVGKPLSDRRTESPAQRTGSLLRVSATGRAYRQGMREYRERTPSRDTHSLFNTAGNRPTPPIRPRSALHNEQAARTACRTASAAYQPCTRALAPPAAQLTSLATRLSSLDSGLSLTPVRLRSLCGIPSSAARWLPRRW